MVHLLDPIFNIGDRLLSKMVYNAGYREVFSSCTLKMLFKQGVFLYKEIDRVYKERKFGFKLNAQVKVSLEAQPPDNLGFSLASRDHVT